MVLKAGYAFLLGATGAAVYVTAGFSSVTKNFASAMGAHGCQRVNGALETIKDVSFPVLYQYDAMIVLVAANFAFVHDGLLSVFNKAAIRPALFVLE